jgi:hypothetical protein
MSSQPGRTIDADVETAGRELAHDAMTAAANGPGLAETMPPPRWCCAESPDGRFQHRWLYSPQSRATTTTRLPLNRDWKAGPVFVLNR